MLLFVVTISKLFNFTQVYEAFLLLFLQCFIFTTCDFTVLVRFQLSHNKDFGLIVYGYQEVPRNQLFVVNLCFFMRTLCNFVVIPNGQTSSFSELLICRLKSNILPCCFKNCLNLHRLYSNHDKGFARIFNVSLFLCLHGDRSTTNLSFRCPNFIFFSWNQCATIGRMQIAAATGMNRWSCGNAGKASKLDRSGLVMLLWIILSSSLSLMVDGQMKISPET